jgi:DNA repair protein RadC
MAKKNVSPKRFTAMKRNTASAIAEIELVYHNRVPASQRPKVTCSASAYRILLDSWDAGKISLLEQFRILLLDRGNRVMGTTLISTGGIAGTVADPKIIFVTALKCRASGIVLAHNHPSGNLTPSQADMELTRKLKQGGQWLELPILDHLILSPEGYYSMADEGIL